MTWTDFNEYNSDVQFQIGQRIQKLRIDKKIAAVDLAVVLDIHSNQMSRIENGRANCTVPQLYVISQILGCLGKNTTKVRNIKSYLLASLFNAGSTISSYYRAEVNHDMPQFAG